jgi:hypothetical protein
MVRRYNSLSPEQAAKYAPKARIYQTPTGNRLNVYAIAVKHQVTPETIRRYQRNGWPGLNGCALATLPLAISDYSSRKDDTYSEAEVLAAIEPPGDTGYVLVDGELWPTSDSMRELLKVSKDVLGRWNLYCPEIEEGLFSVPVMHLAAGHRRNAYKPDLADKIRKKRQQISGGRFTNAKSVELDSGKKIRPGFTWLAPKLTVLALRKVWNAKPSSIWGRICELIRRGKLRAKQFGFLEPDPKVYWCLERDVKRLQRLLLKRRESRRNRSKSSNRLVYILTAFDGVFPGSPKRFTIRRAAQELSHKLLEMGTKRRIGFAKTAHLAEAAPERFGHVFSPR